MAVVIDNTGMSNAGAAVSGLNINSFAVGSGANRMLLACYSAYDASNRTVTATFNTTESLTLYDSYTSTAQANHRLKAFRRLAPSNVTATVAFSFSDSVAEVVVGADSWTGVDQTTPLDGSAKDSDNHEGTPVPSVTVSSAVGNMVHDVIVAYSNYQDTGLWLAADASQAERWDQQTGVDQTEGAGSSEAGASSVTMSWDYGGLAVSYWALMGFNIRAASEAPPATNNDRRSIRAHRLAFLRIPPCPDGTID